MCFELMVPEQMHGINIHRIKMLGSSGIVLCYARLGVLLNKDRMKLVRSSIVSWKT